ECPFHKVQPITGLLPFPGMPIPQGSTYNRPASLPRDACFPSQGCPIHKVQHTTGLLPFRGMPIPQGSTYYRPASLPRDAHSTRFNIQQACFPSQGCPIHKPSEGKYLMPVTFC
uniref:Uncharacterized protein n=1 Tax=Oncorhynchus mykiss TaxID=8022 RepID=A0A8K9XGY0_ONCMY